MEELRRSVGAAWEERRQRLEQAQQLQQFRQQADNADSWLASKEAFLNNDDLGVRSFFSSFNIVLTCLLNPVLVYCEMCPPNQSHKCMYLINTTPISLARVKLYFNALLH